MTTEDWILARSKTPRYNQNCELCHEHVDGAFYYRKGKDGIAHAKCIENIPTAKEDKNKEEALDMTTIIIVLDEVKCTLEELLVQTAGQNKILAARNRLLYSSLVLQYGKDQVDAWWKIKEGVQLPVEFTGDFN